MEIGDIEYEYEESPLPVWPPTLPIEPLLADFSEENPILSTGMTTGNKSTIMRRVATRRQKKLYVAFHFTRYQVSFFERFYNDGLNEGLRRFEFEHPRTRKIIQCSFDPTTDQAYTITPYITAKMKHYKAEMTFIVWS